MKNRDKHKSDESVNKRIIRQLKEEIRILTDRQTKLLSEIRTLEASLKSSLKYIDNELSSLSIEDVVSYFSQASKGKKRKQKVDYKLEDLKSKWNCFKCGTGILKMSKIIRQDGLWYFRKCSDCDNRTDLKPHNESVEE